MKKLRLALILLLALPFYSCSPSAIDKGFKPKDHALYIGETRIKAQEVPPPPAAGSPEDIEDLKILHEWQVKRTAADCAAAGAQAKISVEDAFGKSGVFSEPFPDEVKAFFTQVKDDTDVAVSFFKNKYAKPRPFRRDSSLDPCLGKIGGFAYPSGHAAISRVYALVLAELVPERKNEFLQEADKAALNRIIGGVHHPSDVEAGKKLAESVFLEFMKNPDFRARLDSLKIHLKK